MRLFLISFALLAVLFAFALLVSALALLGTWAMGALHRSRPGVLRLSRLSGLMLASVFLGFQKLVHPHVGHAIVQEMKDRDDSGDDREPCGGRHYREQLRRIRRGEQVGDLQLVRDGEEPSP
jgi:hypothetical protein